jgi:hypothetical protein
VARLNYITTNNETAYQLVTTMLDCRPEIDSQQAAEMYDFLREDSYNYPRKMDQDE